MDEELEELDYVDRLLWKKAGSPSRSPDLDVSNLLRLHLTLSHHDAEQFLLFATRSARAFVGKDTLVTKEVGEVETGSGLSLLHSWAPKLQELILDAVIPYTQYPRKSWLALSDLLVAFPNCRSWALNGVYITELGPTWNERTTEEQSEIEKRKTNRLKFLSIKEKTLRQDPPVILLQDVECVYGRELRKLSVEGIIQITPLEWLLAHAPRLQELTLAQVLDNTAAARARQVFETLALNCPDLRALHLTKPLSMGDGGYDAWDAMLVSLCKLESLTLPSWYIFNEVFDSLASRHGNFELEENELTEATGTKNRDRNRRGLVQASFPLCSISDTSGIRRWLTSQASWRLVVLDFSGTLLNVNIFAPLPANVSAGADAQAEAIVEAAPEEEEVIWGCDKTLEVLKIDRIGFLSSRLYNEERLAAALADARRVRQRLERLVRLKTLSIGRASVPRSIFLPQDDPDSTTSASLSDSPTGLPAESVEPNTPILFKQLTFLRLEGLYPKLGPSEVDRLFLRYPSLVNFQAVDTFTPEGLEHYMEICKK